MSYPADRAFTQTVVSAVGYTDSANVSAAHKVLDGLLRQQSRQLSTEINQALLASSSLGARTEPLIYCYEVQSIACGVALCGRWRAVWLGQAQQATPSTSVPVKEIVKLELLKSPGDSEKHNLSDDGTALCDTVRITVSLPAGSGYTNTVSEQPLEALMDLVRRYERPVASMRPCSSLGLGLSLGLSALFGRSRGEGYVRI